MGDFTYIRIAAGFYYLAAILDACNRKVVGYAISRTIDTPWPWLPWDRPCKAATLRPGASSTLTADAKTLARPTARLQGSMSSVNDPYYNAQAESFMNTLKVEEVYNARRSHFALGYQSPNEFENQPVPQVA